MMLALLMLVADPALAGHPPSAVLEDAVVVDVTTDGLATIGDLALEIVPTELALPGIASGSTDWLCFTDDYFGLFDSVVNIEVTRVDIAPSSDGILRAALDVSVMVSHSGSAGRSVIGTSRKPSRSLTSVRIVSTPLMTAPARSSAGPFDCQARYPAGTFLSPVSLKACRT